MEPRQLLNALMKEAGDTPSSLARALNHEKATQPQIHKFVRGTVREPKRAMMLPIAEHYGVPVDAFYDLELTDRVASERGLGSTEFAGQRVEEGRPQYAKQTKTSAEPTALAAVTRWPFRHVTFKRFAALPASARSEIDEHLALLVRQHEARLPAQAKQTAV